MCLVTLKRSCFFPIGRKCKDIYSQFSIQTHSAVWCPHFCVKHFCMTWSLLFGFSVWILWPKKCYRYLPQYFMKCFLMLDLFRLHENFTVKRELKCYLANNMNLDVEYLISCCVQNLLFYPQFFFPKQFLMIVWNSFLEPGRHL